MVFEELERHFQATVLVGAEFIGKFVDILSQLFCLVQTEEDGYVTIYHISCVIKEVLIRLDSYTYSILFRTFMYKFARSKRLRTAYQLSILFCKNTIALESQ